MVVEGVGLPFTPRPASVRRPSGDHARPRQSHHPEGDTELEKFVAKPAKESLASFLENRERLVGRLSELTPAEWHRGGRHPEFPFYDVHFQVEYMTHHEAHHIYQMFQRRVPLGALPH